MSMAGRAGLLSVLIALAPVGNTFGQEPLNPGHLKFVCPVGEACTITFVTNPGLQIVTRASSDLECWSFVGGCSEVSEGHYQFIDLGAEELPTQFYQFGVFDPEVALPPQLEQLRAQMGDEQFAQWLQSNLDIFGTLQGTPQEEIEGWDGSSREQFAEMEEVLQVWLRDFHNEATFEIPDLELPMEFEELRLDWGDYDFGRLLVENLDNWGNLQGVCDPLVIEWEQNEPLVFEKFELEELLLQQWFESYLMELPQLVLVNFAEEKNHLPPAYEQLRQELGDEAFAQWLETNLQESGNHQGVGEIPGEGAPAREEFEVAEENLQNWLEEFKDQNFQ